MKKLITGFGLLLVVMLAGCATVKPYNYYILQAHAPLTEESVSGQVGLFPVAIPGWFDSNFMAWNDGSVKVFRSDSERWGTEPQQLITGIVRENLERINGDDLVTIGPWLGKKRPDLVLSLEITNVEMAGDTVTLTARWQVANKKKATEGVYESRWQAQAEGKTDGEKLANGLSQALLAMSRSVAGTLSLASPVL